MFLKKKVRWKAIREPGALVGNILNKTLFASNSEYGARKSEFISLVTIIGTCDNTSSMPIVPSDL
jgi:hypothetical protein